MLMHLYSCSNMYFPLCTMYVRLQASGTGLFCIRANVKALITGSITK